MAAYMASQWGQPAMTGYTYAPGNLTGELPEGDADEEDEKDEGCCMEHIKCFVKVKKMLFWGIFAVLFIVTVIVMHKAEGWDILTSAYVTMQIVTTVGYGDLVATTTETRIIMTVFVLFIVIFAASLINDIGNNLVTKQQDNMRAHLREKMQARKKGLQASATHKWYKRLKLPSLLSSMALFSVFILFGTIFYATYEACSCSYGATMADNYSKCTEATCRAPTEAAGGGRTISFLQAFYMSVITLTTVGFGDYTPVSFLGRGIGIFWMFLGVLAGGNMVSCILTTLQALQTQQESKSKVTEDLLKKVSKTGSTGLNKNAFMMYMLIKQGYMTEKEFDQYKKMFDSVDVKKTGKLSAAAIAAKFGDDEE